MGCEADRDDQIYQRAFRVLNQGIRMGRVHWEFLAFGNSQIRENGAYLFCSSEDSSGNTVTCEKEDSTVDGTVQSHHRSRQVCC